ncbi:MAG TPA: bacterial proteasome activator family protein [Micromonosporaceae bacterium]|nr:bacterial proteasome activator family protein [Micromonosporaceae bacterium]
MTETPGAQSAGAQNTGAQSAGAQSTGAQSTGAQNANQQPDSEPRGTQQPSTGQAEKREGRTVLVVGPDGRPVGAVQANEPRDREGEDPSRLVEQPAKVMRIGSMIKQLLDEVKSAPLDERARVRLTEIHRQSIEELESGLAPELVDELERIALPFEEGTTPTEAELRVAQAQLVGWLEGLFHGIQAVLVAQQMAARVQLEQMRAGRPALPSGPPGIPGMPGVPPHPPGGDRSHEERPGQYL